MSNQEVFSNYNDEWRKKFKVDFFQYTYFQKTKFKVFFNYGVEVNVSLGTVSFLAVWEWNMKLSKTNMTVNPVCPHVLMANGKKSPAFPICRLITMKKVKKLKGEKLLVVLLYLISRSRSDF